MAVIWSYSNQCYLDIRLSLASSSLLDGASSYRHRKIMWQTITAKKKKRWMHDFSFADIFLVFYFRFFFVKLTKRTRGRVREKAKALFHKDINTMSNVC